MQFVTMDCLFPLHAGGVVLPTIRGRHAPGNLIAGYELLKLLTDSIGNFTLNLTNLVIGSAVQIETQAGTMIEYRVATVTSELFTVPVYGVGNASNNLRIKVRKGSTAPFYQSFETLMTAVVGSASVYIAQVSDE